MGSHQLFAGFIDRKWLIPKRSRRRKAEHMKKNGPV